MLLFGVIFVFQNKCQIHKIYYNLINKYSFFSLEIAQLLYVKINFSQSIFTLLLWRFLNTFTLFFGGESQTVTVIKITNGII